MLNSAKRNGIQITVNKGELQLKLSKANAIDPHLLQEIKDNKKGIIDFLNNNKLKSTRMDESENPLKRYDRNSIKRIRLSFSQERLWFIDQLEGTVQYHLPTVLRLTGKLNRKALAYALQTVVDRHESLRSVIFEEHGEAYQQVMEAKDWELLMVNGSVYKNDREGLHQFIRQLISGPFDLSKDYMLRAALVSLEEQEHVLIVTMHHIASDGWSLPIIVKEVVELYESFVEGRPSKLAPLEIQYADFAIWQRNYLKGAILENKLGYWKEKLKGVSSLQLPTDFPRPFVQSTHGTSAGFTIDKELADQVQMLCQQEGTTLFMTLLAAFKVLLYRYTGQQDICVGTPIAGRQQEEIEGLVGFFINTLALRTEVSGEVSFTSLLADVKNTTIDAYEHQEAPFEKVVEVVVKERDMSRSPLFQVMFVLQNTQDTPELKLPELSLSGEILENNTSKFDLGFYITETANGLQGAVEYCTGLYKEETITRMIDHYKELLFGIIKTPHQKIGLLPMLTRAEECQLLKTFNDTEVAFPADKSVVDLFEEQVLKTPQSTALVLDDVQLTYHHLNERSNQLAHYLRSKEVKAGTLVTVCMGRSIEMVIGIIGILKAGGVYVPIDVDYPEERIRYILEDTGVKILITNNDFATSFAGGQSLELICVDSYDATNQPSTNLPVNIAPDHLVCVIYTSGSTGKPKGVKLDNAGILNRLYWMWRTFPFEPEERNAIKTSIGFVDHICELFGPLNRGIASVIFRREELLDLDILVKKLAAEKITRWVLVPSLLRTLLMKLQDDSISLPHLKYWTSSGETLPFDLVTDFYKVFPSSSHKLLNIYGSCEVTADVSYYDTSVDDYDKKAGKPQKYVPIGKPISNTKLYIIDKHEQLVAQGVAGEICIAGMPVAQGYLNLPGLTSERFTRDIFSEKPGSRIFRSGDYGRWLADGNIEYLGRIDDQVKIRGNRVELGEIENVLQQAGRVKQCVVLAKKDYSGNNNLVGYVVAEEAIDKKELSAFLKDRLPDYMVPFVWVQLESLPLTASGKINKRALPDPGEDDVLGKEYIAPSTELEERLTAIWRHLLGKERIGIKDNFFELGGHSLLAMRVVSSIRKALEMELSLKDLFSHSTIESLAVHLQKQDKGLLLPSIEIQPRPEQIPLSFSQERLWFIDRLEGSIQYHIPVILRLKGKLNMDALSWAIQTIVERHEVLHTLILEEEGHAYQYIQDHKDWELTITNASTFDNEALQTFIQQIINAPFDLSKDYMLRAGLIVINEAENVLVVTMHHIAADGWSMSVIVKEVVELYASHEEGRTPTLPPLPVQYADYAIWQRKYLQGESWDKKLEYWKDKLEGATALQLPTDYSRPPVLSTNGAITGSKLGKELSGQLQSLSKQQGTTLFMTLLAAFKVLLYRYSGQQDICVGTPIAGRQHQELEGLIGFFVNTLALRSELIGSCSFKDLLQQVKTTTLEAYEHQEVPFEKVVDAVVKERDLGRSPLVQVMLVLQNTPEVQDLRLGEVALSREVTGSSAHNTSKFELTFNIAEPVEGLYVSVEYCTGLYNEQTIKKMMAHFNELLNSVVKAPDQSIGLLPMLTNSEEQQLIFGFNNEEVDYPKDKTIVDLIEEQVQKYPLNIAVVFEKEQLTYQQLNERSNQLAHYLRSKGVTVDTLVPVCLERNIAMIIGIVGILKAGGAYVPIDPEYPVERIQYMVEDTQSTLVVVGKDTVSRINSVKEIELIVLDKEGALNDQPKGNLRVPVHPHHLAYVIYTSGSTGKPKGVLIEHRNVVRLFKTESALYDFNEKDVWSVFHSFCFDFSVWEMYGALFYGGRMVVVPKHVTKNVTQFAELLLTEKVTVLNQTPSAFYILQEALVEKTKEVPIRYVIFGGEALNPSKLKPWMQSYPNSKLINMYGITETTVHVTYQEIEWQHTLGGKSIIGKPIPTLSAYILDSNQNLVPVGVAGELLISGEGLARGYLNRPELTAEKFVKNPFSKVEGARMYRTGDLGRYLTDGNIEYLGRMDEQVKIRGYRIELGEIESVLQECNLVRQAVVLAKVNEDGGKRLVAYVVPVDIFDKAAIKSYLSNRLPEYMIPLQWVELESLPLTNNGKIDRKALPDPDISELLSNQYVAPRNEAEEKLAAVWKELLHVERVGIHDNFFELGGDSILTIQVVSRARRLGFNLQPKDLFIHQTIGRLSAAIVERSGANVVGEQGILTGLSGLLPIQQWWLEMDQAEIAHFNQSVLLGLDKVITASELGQAIEQLMEHHDALRFKYYQQDNKWQQEYGTYIGEVITEDFQSTPPGLLGSTITETASAHHRSLDLEKGELIRIALMQTPASEAENRLLIVIHHLAIDGVSWRILLEDLELLLSGLKEGKKTGLGHKSSSYRQWYHALESYGRSRKLLSQITWWQQAEKNYHALPVDKNYTDLVKVKDIAQYSIRLGVDQTTRLLQEVPRVYHTEINDILLAALARTIAEWSEQDTVTIGLEGHGREDINSAIDTSRTIGWFTSLYPCQLVMPGLNSEADLIKSVKEQLRQLPDKGLGYGVLKYINKETSLQGTEPWDIVFNYFGQLDNVVRESKWLSGAGESPGADRGNENIVNEKISVNSSVRAGELMLSWSYSCRHYDEATIRKLSGAYLSNLEKLIAHCMERQRTGEIFFTPSDYGLGSEITYEEMDRFLSEPYNGKQRRDSIVGLYRLSGLQQGMLFHGLFDKGIGAYIVQFGCDLFGVNLQILERSWAHLMKRHSILRSAFYFNEFGVPVQCVYKEATLPLTVLDYRALSDEEQVASLKEFEEADRSKGFDFKAAPLMRLGLFQLGDDRYRMIWTSHHILFDGWSMSILMEEFLSTYELLRPGGEAVIIEEDRYEDYIRYLERNDKEQEEKYWRNYLRGIEQNTLLPFIGTTAGRNKGLGDYASLSLLLDAVTTTKIQGYAQRHHLTINTIMQGVWAFLLHRYTGNKNIVYGIIVSGRPDDLPGVEQRVGMYINTLPLHSAIKEGQGIVEWLQGIQAEQVNSRQYQYTPLHVVQGWSGVKGDLFDTMLAFENYPVSKVISSKQWALEVGNVKMQEQTNYPLSINIGSADLINILFSYNTLLLEAVYVNEIRGHFENVLLQLIETEVGGINDISLLTSAAQQRLLVDFNNTKVDYPTDKTLVDLFEEQVAKTPDSIAVVLEEQQFTYRELNERSNQFGHYLRGKGIKEETLVPICLDRSLEMIVGILGIVKAGGAYVPIDPDYPEDRIRYMLKDTGAVIAVCNQNCISKLAMVNGLDVIAIDTEWPVISQQPLSNVQTNLTPNNLAYVIYTSGSTGKPKGVMNEHAGVVNRLLWAQDYYGLTSKDAVLQKTTFCFDVSVWELFWPLLVGSRLVFAKPEGHKDADYLKHIIGTQNITMLHFVPSMLGVFLSGLQPGECKGLKKVLCSGEALKQSQVALFIEKLPEVELHNLYGPTEAAIDVTYWSLSNKREAPLVVPIGKPVSNTSIYILDAGNSLVPLGAIGEINIGGVQVARGYLNRPELSAEKFVSDPFRAAMKMYRTGDLGRWLHDGNIEYMGRMDEQVKIRGYRIELGEIENVLQQSSIVSQSVVVAKEDKQGINRLVAYIVANGSFDKEEIQDYLNTKLPEYMVPALWVVLEDLPLTPNGKINRKALPDPGISGLMVNEYVAPKNEVEKALVEIWQDLLGVERIGIHDNFFELGGHSLLTMRVVSLIRKELDVELAISTFFELGTIEKIASYIKVNQEEFPVLLENYEEIKL